jgi:hypothetical protein
MLYVVSVYWPYMLAVFALGAIVGWWFQDARNIDDTAGWLDSGPDRP